VVTKKFNIAAATELLRDNHFSYVLPASRTHWGSSSGRQDIDNGDVTDAAKVQ